MMLKRAVVTGPDMDPALFYHMVGQQEDPRLPCKEPLPLMEEEHPTLPGLGSGFPL